MPLIRLVSSPVLSLALLLAPSLALVSPATASAQAIQRCEAADGGISYSNEQCPPGTRASKALAPTPVPTAAAQKEARDRVQRDKEVAKSLEAQRRPPLATSGAASGQVPVAEARQAADCAYLRAELDASRRLRNVLTTRPYYSLDDVDQMDIRTTQLAADYRRFCSR